MKLFRIEVTFNNGRFVAFKHVKSNTIDHFDQFMRFTHGKRNDVAWINKNEISFIEIMDEEKLD